MSKRKKQLIVLLVSLIGVFIVGYNYLYQDHRNIEEETAKMTLSSTQLQGMFSGEDSQKVLNQTIVVNGTISQIEENTMTLDEAVHCSFSTLTSTLKVGDKVSVKGRCIGYDDLFEIVKLDQSTLTK